MSSLEESENAAAANGADIRIDIGIVIPSLEKYGGAERFVIECVRHWQHRHDITIYAASFDRLLLKESGIINSVRLVELSGNFEGEHSFVTNAVLLPKVWRQEIGRHDVYHTHLWPTHLIDLHPMVWFPHEPLRALHDLRFEQRLANIGDLAPYDVHVYPKFDYDRVSVELYDAYLSAIDGMDKTAIPEYTIANSRYSARYLADAYGRAMPYIVYPGVDIESPIDLKVDQKLFVTISQLWPHKRINLLIEAVALTDEIQLIVIGSGPELDRLRSLCIKLGVDNRVFFLSGLSHYEIRLVLARACAFVFCPIREPFGIVVLEAMAAGKPIIAVNEGGYVEVCSAEYALLLPASPLSFAEAMQRFRDDPELTRRMGEAARRNVVPYTWKRAAVELEGFLKRACAESARASTAHSAPGRTRPLVGIQYYAWYGDGFGEAHWNDNLRSGHVADHPFLGFYSSDRGRTIEYHLNQFENMKLDYVIVNLHIDDKGPNQTELRSIRNLFDIAKTKTPNLRFAIQISPYNEGAGYIQSVIATIEQLYAGRDNYLRVDGKPVLFWFWSSEHDGNRALLETMSRAASGFRNLAVSLRMAKGVDENRFTFDFFEGFALYSPLELASEENWTAVWESAEEASTKANMAYRMVTVSPGYDDRGLADPLRQGNPRRVVPRKSGETYARSMEFVDALPLPPDFVIVSTYNEYHENTHIETSSVNGDRYINMTRDFVERVHSMALGVGRPHE
jgi:glycosyltransferase involved in cell wall biosynthesis